MTIKQIYYNDFSIFHKQMIQEKIIFAEKTEYYGVYDLGQLVGITGLLFSKNKVTFKNHWVVPKYRGKGYFKAMMIFSLNITKGKTIEATCTPMSIKHYIHLGFNVVKVYKNECIKVFYENL